MFWFVGLIAFYFQIKLIIIIKENFNLNNINLGVSKPKILIKSTTDKKKKKMVDPKSRIKPPIQPVALSRLLKQNVDE